MNREKEVSVNEERSEPNKVILSDGSYILWDHKEGFYRVAYYECRRQKGSDLEMTIALAMKKAIHHTKVKNIFSYISRTDSYAAVGS